ncbi:uncharacterized protein LOC6049292 isoform X2 [Culex quinquefasciatus]|nr:uncharacterized protein LOC6049292 isoform X2 [Culex quinquefasciatus]
MGANVSRHHEKGLTGRRAQSTDNLKSDQSSPYHQYNHYGGKNNITVSSSNNNNNNNNHPKQLKSVPPDLTPGEEFLGSGSGSGTEPDEQLLEQQQQQFLASNGINPHDRNKFCGSLPNHLDADDACEAIFKQNEFLQTHLKNVLASHQQQQPEYVTVAPSGTSNVTGGGGGHQPMAGSSSSSQPPPYHQQSSPFYSSSSGKGSTISSTALGSSTFRSGSVSGGERPDIQLKLPLHRMCPSMDTGYDQGYGSERSPEDELPPPLLLMHEAQYNEILATSQLTQQPPASVIEPDDLQRFWNYEKAAASLIASGEYSFITKDSVFLVQVPKGTRGLGLSVSGGSDSSAPFPGLIRIKRLFPHQAAWATGMLQPGDILLEANGIPLTGLTNYEALEVLRTAPNYVTLTVCRPQDEQYRKLSPPSEPPRPPLRNPLSSEPASQLQSPQLSSCSSSSSNIAAAAATSNNNNLGQQQQLLHFQQMQQQLSQYNNNSQQQMMPYYYPQQQQQYMFPPQTLAFAPASVADPSQSGFSGEFEIILTKQQGSLGFTLRKEDESVLGHYVRALVRDPALNDGRIRPGDKIVAVNDIPISSMTHEEAVIFLRQSAEVVKLRLYRDQAQTPLSAQSPTFGRRTTTTDGEESTPCHGTTKPKPNLRPEALNLLTDIAHRKQSATTTTASNSGGGSTSSSVKSSNASPRRLRRGLQGQNSKRSYDNHGFQETCSNYSDSETSTIVSHQQMVGVAIPGSGVYHSASCRSSRGAGTTVMSQQQQVQLSSLDDQYYCDEEIESLYDEEDEEGGDGAQKRRPNFLDLAGEGGSTPMSSRKPRFQFSVANTNAYELNNLDNEALDAPTMYALKGSTDPTVAASGSGSSDRDQFMSLPCETFLVACKTEQDLNADSTDAIYVKHFAHKSPLYSSVNVPLKKNVSEVVDAVEKGGKKSLMKWKGATLTSDEDDESTASPAQHQSMDGSSPSLTGSSFPTSSTPDAESSLAATFGTTTGSTTTPTTERELDTANDDGGGLDGDGNKIFTVELNKGWNSRLGFSLKQDPDSRRPAISAIYSESVAAKDGRLRVGDQLLTVNDESVESMSTGQVIDLLRIIRGSICLRLVRIAVHPTIDADIILEEQQPNHSEQPECGENADQIEGETVQQ